jgi:hypothetical protein
MKVMTCRELGGPCDQLLSARTWDGMIRNMMRHVLQSHPDTARAMKEMRNAHRWCRQTKSQWDERGSGLGEHHESVSN